MDGWIDRYGLLAEPHGQGARLPSRLPLLSLVVVPEPTCSPAASSLSEAAERERERGRESGEQLPPRVFLLFFGVLSHRWVWTRPYLDG